MPKIKKKIAKRLRQKQKGEPPPKPNLQDLMLKELHGPVFTILWAKIFPYLKWIAETYPDLKKDYDGIIIGFRGKDGKSTMAKLHPFK